MYELRRTRGKSWDRAEVDDARGGVSFRPDHHGVLAVRDRGEMQGSAFRPTAVTVIGWLFIVAAGYLAVSGLFAMSSRATPEPAVGAMQQPGAVLLVCGIQWALAFFLMVAAVQFLRLRAWARAALEVAAWAGLMLTVGGSAALFLAWVRLASAANARALAPGLQSFTIFGALMGTAAVVVAAAPCAIIIWILRGRTVRRAMDGP